MNGTGQMYKMKENIKHDVSIHTPTCMYKMKNIQSTSTNGISVDHVGQGKKLDIIDQNNENLNGMAELVGRQEDILKSLAELKEQILRLRESIHAQPELLRATTTTATTICPTEFQQDANSNEIIVNVDPASPPYSLLYVQKLLGDHVHLQVETYRHSSVPSLPENSASLSKALETYRPNKTVPKLPLRLIWKNVGVDAELVVQGIPVLGEANMLRYLARISPNQLNYDNNEDAYKIDSVLDVCYLLKKATTKTARHSLLQSLNAQLGKSNWLCDCTGISVADIAATSAIKQAMNSKELSANVTKWMQRCEAVL